MFQNGRPYRPCAGRCLFLWGNLNIFGYTVVDDKIDSFDVDTSSEEIGGDEEAGAVGFEEIVVLDSFLLFEL